MTDPADTDLATYIRVAKATTSCSVKITRKNADGDITSIESMNSMTTGELELTPVEAERVLYRMTEHVARKCYVDLHVHEMITGRELQAAVARIKEQYRQLGTWEKPA